MNLIVSCMAEAIDAQRTEICEHKGDGHPDSLCDGVADAVSQALCGAYLRAYGEIRHHNVDKALLIGGRSHPRFGGDVEVPMRIIIAGCADPLPPPDNVADLAHGSAVAASAASIGAPWRSRRGAIPCGPVGWISRCARAGDEVASTSYAIYRPLIAATVRRS